ncbi:MAG: hypothetical protein ACKO0Z_18145 [Betaproteobacteria bacterium]
MNTNTELLAIEANYVRERAQERLQDAINHLQRSAYELEVYEEKLAAADDDKHRAQVINWAINHIVSNILPNFRIDLLATSQADLATIAVRGAAE